MSTEKTKNELEHELKELKEKYHELKNTLDNYSINIGKKSFKSIFDDESVVLFNNLLAELLNSENISILYKQFSDTLKNLLPDTIILLNSINEKAEESTLEIIEGLEGNFFKRILSIIGYNPIGQKFKLLPSFKEYFSTGFLTEFKGGLADFASFEFPSSIAKTIEFVIGINKIYTIGLKSKGEIIAAIHLITFNHKDIKNKIFIESYLKVAGLIIQRLIAETTSSKDRRMLDNIINSIPQSVFWKDSDGYFLGCNQQFANAVGLTSPSDIVGKTDYDMLCLPKDAEKYRYDDRQVILKNQPKLHIIEKLNQPEGKYIWTDTSKVPLINSDGSPFGVLGISEDITEKIHNEQMLKTNEERLQIALKVTNDVVWDWDVITNTQIWNETGAEAFGWYDIVEAPQPVAWWLEKIHPDDLERVESGFYKVLNEPATTTWYEEYRFLKSNGKYAEVIDRCYVLRNENGNAYRLIGAMKDITEQKRIANELMLSETKFYSYVENAFDGFYILRDKRYEYVNKRFTQITGFSFEELTSDDFDYNVMLSESGRMMMEERYNQRYNGENIPNQYELEIITKQGERRFIEVSTVSVGQVGNIYIIGIMRDITDRKTAEDKVKKESALRQLLMELALNYINLPLNLVDTEINKSLKILGEFVGADRAYTFDYDWDNNVCNNIYEWCADGISPQIDILQNVPLEMMPDWVDAHLQGKEMYVPDVYSLPKGLVREILEPQDIKSVLAVPMINGKKCIGFIGFDYVKNFHDYTETELNLLLLFSQILVNINLRVQSEKDLILAKVKAEESDKLKSSFLANLSHEIRTPMNGIFGFMNILRDPELSAAEKDEFIHALYISGRRLMNTIDDIVTISLIDAGQYSLNISQVHMKEIITNFHDLFEQQAFNKGLLIKTVINDDNKDLILHTDQQKLNIIISNLLSNSIKFTSDGEIEIGFYVKNNSMIIYVKDTGIGIPEQKQQLIFDRFVQIHTDLNRPYEGSGLGLSIVKSYVEILDGKIWLTSEVGKGSTFFVSLPLAP